MKYLILTWALLFSSLLQAAPPVGIGGQSQSLNYINNTIVPYNQATKIGGINTLLETDNENMLVNPNFEHSTITTGWTLGTSNTLTATSTSANIFSGKQAGLLTTSATVAFDLHQDITPPSGLAGTQGELTWALAVPAGITDGQICPRVNGAYLTNYCVSAINNGVYFPYKVPFVFGTAGQTAGLGFITTATYASGTQTVLVDKASLKVGLSGISNLQLDNVYSAQVVTTSGAVSNPNKAGWITCSAANPTVCTFASGIFTQPPNCWTTETTNAVAASIGLSSVTSTGLTASSFNTTTGALTASVPFTLSCQKQGNDYLTSSSAVYSQASANYDWTSYTPTFGAGFGTVTGTNQCKHRRVGGDLEVNCSFTTGTVAASLGTISLPGTLTLDSARITATNTSAAAGQSFGVFGANQANSFGQIVTATGTSTSLVYFSNGVTGATTLVPSNISGIMSSTTLVTANFKVPISGWSNSAQIVGSFAGYTNVPGYQGNVDTFSASFGTTNASTVCSVSPCSYLDQIGNAVTSITRTSAGVYVLNTARTYSKIKCWFNAPLIVAGQVLISYPVGGVNTNAVGMTFQRSDTGGGSGDVYATIFCQGTY